MYVYSPLLVWGIEYYLVWDFYFQSIERYSLQTRLWKCIIKAMWWENNYLSIKFVVTSNILYFMVGKYLHMASVKMFIVMVTAYINMWLASYKQLLWCFNLAMYSVINCIILQNWSCRYTVHKKKQLMVYLWCILHHCHWDDIWPSKHLLHPSSM